MLILHRKQTIPWRQLSYFWLIDFWETWNIICDHYIHLQLALANFTTVSFLNTNQNLNMCTPCKKSQQIVKLTFLQILNVKKYFTSHLRGTATLEFWYMDSQRINSFPNLKNWNACWARRKNVKKFKSESSCKSDIQSILHPRIPFILYEELVFYAVLWVCHSQLSNGVPSFLCQKFIIEFMLNKIIFNEICKFNGLVS